MWCVFCFTCFFDILVVDVACVVVVVVFGLTVAVYGCSFCMCVKLCIYC